MTLHYATNWVIFVPCAVQVVSVRSLEPLPVVVATFQARNLTHVITLKVSVKGSKALMSNQRRYQ